MCRVIRVYGILLIYFGYKYCHAQSVCDGTKGITLSVNPPIPQAYNSVKLTCTATSDLSFITWAKSGIDVATVVSKSGQCAAAESIPDIYSYNCLNSRQYTLTINNVTKNNIGEEWICQGVEQIVTFSNCVTINVIYPVTRVTLTVNSYTSVITVNESNSIQLQCVTTEALPVAYITWYKDNGTPSDTADDTLIPDSGSSHLNTGGTLLTTSNLTFVANRADNGMKIYCTASNGQGNVVVSDVKPLLDIAFSPMESPVIQGFTVGQTYSIIRGSNTQQQLTCGIKGGNPVATLSWSCYPTGNSSTNNTEDTGYSTYTWVGGTTEQNCTCIAQHNLWMSPRSTYVTVRILYPPNAPTFVINNSEVASSGSVTVISETALSIECRTTSNPMAGAYLWLLPDGNTRAGQMLELTNVQSTGNNIYSCTAENEMVPSVGLAVTGRATSYLTINIQGPPRLSMNSSNMTDIKSALHEIALLTAVIEAFPVPTSDNFTWSKCDEESVCQTLQTNKSYIVHVERLQTDLIIKDVKSSDYGQYKLTVSNGIDNPLQVMFHLSQLEILADTSQLSEQCSTASGTMVGTLFGGFAGGIILTVAVVAILRRVSKGTCTFLKEPKEPRTATFEDHEKLEQPVSRFSKQGSNESDMRPCTSQDKAYSELTHYGNTQNAYEDLATQHEPTDRISATYTNAPV